MKPKKLKYIVLFLIMAAITLAPTVLPKRVFATGEATPIPTIDPYETIRQLEESNRKLAEELAAIASQSVPATPTPRPEGPAKLQIVSSKTINAVNARAQDFELTVRNFGSTRAAGIYPSVTIPADAPFQIRLGGGTGSMPDVQANGEAKLAMHMTTNPDAKEGTYAVTLTFSYKDRNDAVVTDTDTINVKVTSTATPPEIVMSDFSSNWDSLIAGANFTLKANISNIGGTDAKNVQLKVDGMGSDTVYMAGAANSYQYVSLAQGIVTPIEFQFTVSSKAKAGTYPLTFTVKYKDNEGKDFERSFIYYATVSEASANQNRAIVEITGLAAPEGEFAPDEEFTIGMEVRNTGANTAKNIKIVAAAGTDEAIVPKSSNTIVINSLGVGESRYIEFTFAATAKAKTQNYALSFTAEYETGTLDSTDKAEKMTFAQFAGVNIVTDDGKAGGARVEIAAMVGPEGVFEPGHLMVVYMTIANTGEYAATNIKVSAKTDADGAIVPMSSNAISIPTLEIGETRDIEFAFAPTAKSKTQNYAIEFKVEYDTGQKDSAGAVLRTSFEQFCGVNVKNDDPQPTPTPTPVDDKRISKPKIIIESYTVDPIIVMAGHEFDLVMVFKNTHADKTITNIKAELTPAEISATNRGSVFIPVNGSNTFYIDRIEPLGAHEKTFRMYTIPAAEPMNYTITVTFKYQDEDLYEYEETEKIGITVKQTTRLSTGNITVPEEAFVGSPIYLYFNIMNTGKSTLNNLTVTVEGNFDTGKSFNYFGTVNKSSSVYYDGEFTPLEEGTHHGKVVMAYEDETGEVTTVEREFTVKVTDMSSMMSEGDMNGMTGMDPSMFEQETSILDKIKEYAMMPPVWGGAAALLVIAIFIRRSVKKKKRVNYDE